MVALRGDAVTTYALPPALGFPARAVTGCQPDAVIASRYA